MTAAKTMFKLLAIPFVVSNVLSSKGSWQILWKNDKASCPASEAERVKAEVLQPIQMKDAWVGRNSMVTNCLMSIQQDTCPSSGYIQRSILFTKPSYWESILSCDTLNSVLNRHCLDVFCRYDQQFRTLYLAVLKQILLKYCVCRVTEITVLVLYLKCCQSSWLELILRLKIKTFFVTKINFLLFVQQCSKIPVDEGTGFHIPI